MNTPEKSRSKVTPLFGSSASGPRSPEEELIFMLDLPEGSPERQAIRDRLPEELVQEFEAVQQITTLGGHLKAPAPSPGIRTTVLQEAHAYQNPVYNRPSEIPTVTTSGMPGWKWTWAAIFLVCSWGLYMEVSPATTVVNEAEQLDSELVQLETELQELYSDLAWDLDTVATEEGWS